MKLSVKTKGIVFSIVVVIVTSLTVTIGSACLSIYQTETANTERLTYALKSIERQANGELEEIVSMFNDFANDPVNNYFVYNSIDIDYFLWQDNTSIFKLAEQLGASRMGFYHPDPEAPDKGDQIRVFYKRGAPIIHKESSKRYVEITTNQFGAPDLKPVTGKVKIPLKPRYEKAQIFELERRQNGLVLVIHLEMKRPKGEHLGYFIIEKPLDLNINVLNKELGVFVTLYDSQGESGPRGVPMTKIDFSSIDLNNKENKRLQDFQGESYDSKITPLTYNDILVGYISVGIPKAETSKKLRETVLLLSLLAFLIAIPVVMFGSVIVSRAVTPILTLTEAAADIAKGNLNRKLDLKANDEMGILANSFTNMRDAIKQKINELQEINKNLDKRVEKRSVQISQQNEILDTFLEMIPYAVYFKDVNGTYTRVNSVFSNQIGYKNPKDLMGQTDRDIATQTTGKLRIAEDMKVIQSGLIVNDSRVAAYDDDGNLVSWIVTKRPLKNADGKIVGMVSVSRKKDTKESNPSKNAPLGDAE